MRENDRPKQPRPYQLTAEQQVIEYATENPTGRLLLVIPTRGGKTFVGARLAKKMALRHGLRVLWLAHREELLDEAVAHLIDAGIPRASIGMIKAGRISDPSAKVQVASEQTLDRRSSLPVAHLVITDEAHRDTAPRRRRLRRAYPNAFLLGLTATPKPPPQRDLGEDYDTLMVVTQPSELIHDGYLAVPTVFAPDRDEIPDFRGLRVVHGDWRAEDLEKLLLKQSLLDEQVSEWHRLSDGRTSLAFPVTIAHSMALADRFRAAGIRAVHLDGASGRVERRDVVSWLKGGEIPIACSVGIFSEGTNLPRVKCILGVRPTRSLTLYIQMSMRCGTPWEGVQPRILDVVGNCYTFGYPFADRKWSLVNRESGLHTGKSGGVLKRCPNCGAMMPVAAGTCGACTAPFPIVVPSISDRPLTLLQVSPEERELNQERERLVTFATERKFADPEAWADRVLAAKHGEAA